MTRRDFEVIAATISQLYLGDEALRAHIAGVFADNLYMTNPRFDRERFLKACGL
jgi:hypothetical protein